MIDGTEGVHGYGTDNYDVKGITLKQHMVIEFTKSESFDFLGDPLKIVIAGEDKPEIIPTGLDDLRAIDTFADGHTEWYIRTKVKYAIKLANEVIKQLNDEKEADI